MCNRTFFGGPVYVHRHHLSMPVQLLRDISVVEDIDRRGLTFLEADQGAGELSVVVGGRNNAVGRDFDGDTLMRTV